MDDNAEASSSSYNWPHDALGAASRPRAPETSRRITACEACRKQKVGPVRFVKGADFVFVLDCDADLNADPMLYERFQAAMCSLQEEGPVVFCESGTASAVRE